MTFKLTAVAFGGMPQVLAKSGKLRGDDEVSAGVPNGALKPFPRVSTARQGGMG